MYLKRIEITGFKSFASKTRLELEPGITAIVGPNGAGKSNISDAIRWAMGEQSSRNLRLKKNEEVVFAGTAKRAKGSFAEVSLLLDNTDDRMPIGYSEVELVRRLYRNGDTEYRINGAKARLSDAQQLLTAAGFGPSSYSIIGQGTIDSFVLATPTERKLLFDEASGIRTHELGREAALRKLAATDANLTRASDIVGELAPRLAALEKRVTAARQREDLAARLATTRRDYLAAALGEHTRALVSVSAEGEQLAQEQAEYGVRVKDLEAERLRLQKEAAAADKQRAGEAERLTKLELARDKLAGDISLKQAELQYANARAAESPKGDAAAIRTELKSIDAQIAKTRDAIAVTQEEHAKNDHLQKLVAGEVSALQRQLTGLRDEADQSSQAEAIEHSLTLLKHVAVELARDAADHGQLRLLIYKVTRLLASVGRGQDELISQIRTVQQELTSTMMKAETIHSHQAAVTIRLYSLEVDLTQLAQSKYNLSSQLANITAIDKAYATAQKNVSQRRRKLAVLQERLITLSHDLTTHREALAAPMSGSSARLVAIASELADAEYRLKQTQAGQTDAESRKETHQTELSRLSALAAEWAVDLPKPSSGGNVAELERHALTVSAKLAATQTADDEAIQEYREVKERHDYLAGQLGDLADAKQHLQELIGRLEATIASQFTDKFAAISERFGHYFASLFGGGTAELILTTGEDGGYGVEIKAVPPGKRVESLAVLSGGERSLTGMALLAAILAGNPSPFVVLDEIDAALDEANSGRIAATLAELAESSQLIIITHNRQTMAAAHSLYGVTMDEHHVSRLLSMRLEEARKYAKAV